MAITKNNVKNVKFLRNGSVFVPSGNNSARQVAKTVMESQLSSLDDGTAILGRYQESNETVKTLVGFAYVNGETRTLTIIDVDDLAELSAKTITDIKSTNDSIDIDTAIASDGTVEVDVITDASKIKMSGFTSSDALSGINASSSITEAFEEVDDVITENERVISNALNDLNGRKIDNIEVNGVEGDITDNVAAVTIDGGDIKLDDYTKPQAKSAIASTDTVNEALGKLEKGLEEVSDSSVQSVSGGSGITVDNTDTSNPIVNAKLANPANITGVAENAIKFNATDNGLYIDILDCGTYGN